MDQDFVQKPLYTMVPDDSSLGGLAGAYRLIAPFAGPFFGFSHGMIPHIAPGQSVHDAYYAATVNAKQWEAIAQSVNAQFATGLKHDMGRTAINLGIPGMFNTSEADFLNKVNAGIGSALGKGIAGMMLQSGLLTPVMGGSVHAAYQNIFSAGPMLASTGGSYMYQNQDAIARATAVTQRVADAIMQRLRGTPNGGIGLLQDLGFSGGFRDEDITKLFTASISGKSTSFGSSIQGAVNELGEFDETKLQAVLEKTKQFTQSLTSAFKSLGNIAGTLDPDKLMAVMDQLTGGKWRASEIGDIGKWNALAEKLNTTKAFATMHGVAPMDILTTAQALQGRLYANRGITAKDIAAGFGTNTGLMNLDMSMRVHGTMWATGRNTEQDRMRIIEQESWLQNAGMDSTGGKAMTLLALMKQNGAINVEQYKKLSSELTAGSAGVRGRARDEIYRLFTGDVGTTRELLAQPGRMLLYRSQLTDESMAEVGNMVASGQTADFARAEEVSRQKRLEKLGTAIERGAGMYAGPYNDADAEAMKARVIVRLAKDGADVGVLEQVYDRALAETGSPAKAYAKMMRAVSSTASTRPFAGTARDAARAAANDARAARLSAAAFGTDDNISALTGIAGIDVSGNALSVGAIGHAVGAGMRLAGELGLDVANSAEINKVKKTDPGRAFMMLQSALASAPAAERASIMKEMARTARDKGTAIDRLLSPDNPMDKLITDSETLKAKGMSARHYGAIADRAKMSDSVFAKMMEGAKTAGEREAVFNQMYGAAGGSTLQDIVAYVQGNAELADVLGFVRQDDGTYSVTTDDLLKLDAEKWSRIQTSMSETAAIDIVKNKAKEKKERDEFFEISRDLEKAREIIDSFDDETGSEAFGSVTEEDIDRMDVSAARVALKKFGVDGVDNLKPDQILTKVKELAGRYQTSADMYGMGATQASALKELRDSISFEATKEEKAKLEAEKERKKAEEKGMKISGTLTMIDEAGRKHTVSMNGYGLKA